MPIVKSEFNALCKKVLSEIIHTGKAKSIHEVSIVIDEYSHVIYAIWRGEKVFSKNHINSLCKCYNVDARYFFGQSEQIFI
jgi:L-rhamnose mutarotase